MTHKDENESDNDEVQNHMISQETVSIEEVRILRQQMTEMYESWISGQAPPSSICDYLNTNMPPPVQVSISDSIYPPGFGPYANAFNLLWLAFAFYDPLDANNDLPDLGIMLREVFAQLTAENIKDIDSECVFESLSEVLESLSTNENIKTYRFTSWCNIGLYDVNFGWGKPVWVAHMGDLSTANVRSKQQFVFIESACREGIELWVASDDEEIRILEKDAKFLAYANPNPSIFIN